MKKLIIYSLLIVQPYCLAVGQNLQDALMISKDVYGGTARAVSMGGAFGALGGDFSVASTNPAGLAVFRSSSFTLTPTVYHSNAISTYRGNSTEDFEYRFNLNNLGYVWSFNSGNDNGWAGTSLAVGYNRLNDFTKRVLITDNSATSSLLDEFVFNSNNNMADQFYEDVAWNADLLFRDTITGEYFSDFSGSEYGQSQQKSLITKGGKGEYFVSFSANYAHRLYIGATIGMQRIKYEENTDHFEEDVSNTIPFTRNFNFMEYYKMRGTGYTFKVGVIGRPVDFLRIGAAFHLPTLYKLNSEFYTEMASAFDSGEPLYLSASSPLNEYDFNLITPFKAIGSIAFQVEKYGLLSIEYEFMDYTQMRLRSDEESFTDVNENIQEVYQATSNIRAGAEVRLGPLALRGGYALYGDPYSSNQVNDGASNSVISAGIGLNSKDFFVDLAYVHSSYDEEHFLYSDKTANIDLKTNKVLATFGLRF